MKILTTLLELQNEAGKFVHALVQKKDSATLVTLAGELGAGKTSFAQGVARELGITEIVTSPTFVLLKSYEVPEVKDTNFKRLIHIDAYRLEGGKSVAPLELEKYLKDSESLILLEWPEMIQGELPDPDSKISLEVLSDNTRSITYG